ncbi:uncharacterized protein F4822DRAFT_242218 [Hypoxylon trugodes]|uniref:uncharacterized protein n=1 Tax=Hypoxylon trugodes TaxID=326681 RepID=UPI002197BD21|nr:uncharacterized protein F4822DRAFT_242218 [Hypoxylon trugodes]KAI1388329.1 hypothetical protein F4822DRAFT_242218 [Hypoxylon trugodes]
MSRPLSSRWLHTAFNIAEHPRRLELPLFLCPSINLVSRGRRSRTIPSSPLQRTSRWTVQRRCLHGQTNTVAGDIPLQGSHIHPLTPARKLPRQCYGCGAFSQIVAPDQPGYYDLTRKNVQRYLNPQSIDRSRHEDKIYEDALRHFDPEMLKSKGVDVEGLGLSLVPSETQQRPPPKVPLCDRCHNLHHYSKGESIYHPSVDSILDTILESPYKYNHVYHILDAADFPMSLSPRISQFLDLMPLRTKNRRAKTSKFYGGHKIELNFVITRMDLLAPTEKQVNSLFPYLREVLRETLGRTGRNVRLGNLVAVSAKRGWHIPDLKKEIYEKGGASWMLGKANVGKSRLFEAVFPKGKTIKKPPKHLITIDMHAKTPNEEAAPTEPAESHSESAQEVEEEEIEEEGELDEYALLPPARKEVNYPEMPLVSDLPGTTASPIRIPFGNGRGELIDLPGLERTGLEQYVKQERRRDLIMRSRMAPEQLVIKPGRSLLLGGFIRITPREPAPIILAYSFTPLEAHVTSTSKAISIQGEENEINIENIAVPGTGEKTKLAGSFELKWDVTKQRSGPLMQKYGADLKLDRMPFRVLSTDILIEGVGWVEITTQVRTKELYGGAWAPREEQPQEPLSALAKLEAFADAGDGKKQHRHVTSPSTPHQNQLSQGQSPSLTSPLQPRPVLEERDPRINWPIVDVYTPEGKFISTRRPMNAWLLNKPTVSAASKKTRPRRAMKGQKKLWKARKRAGMTDGSRHLNSN